MLHSRFVVPGRLNAHIAFTDRHGGYSSGDFSSFNLARHVGDDEAMVAANRSALSAVLGLGGERLSFVSQVHGTAIAEVTRADLRGPAAEADAQITTESGLGLAIMVADCTPVMLADPEAGIIAAVHAGRPGMSLGIVGDTVERMRELGAGEIHAVIGPSICPRCYEVPEEMRAEVAAIEPVTASVSVTGTPAIDVAAGVAEQLRRAGVAIDHFSRTCTRESDELFSYRRQSRTGRFVGVVWMQAENLTTHP